MSEEAESIETVHERLLKEPGAEELHNLYLAYTEKADAHRFLSQEEGTKDVFDHFKKISRKYKNLSENFLKVRYANPFRRHYKMRSTYVYGQFEQVARREWATKVLIVNYIKSPKGTIYFAMSLGKRQLSIYAAHVFDRFTQRVTNKDFDEDNSRTEAILEIIRRMEAATKTNKMAGVPLIDEETNSAYLPVEDGYLVGHFGMYGGHSKESRKDNGPEITREVVYYKTFLSHHEVSDKKMDLLLELNRERKEMIARYEKEL